MSSNQVSAPPAATPASPEELGRINYAIMQAEKANAICQGLQDRLQDLGMELLGPKPYATQAVDPADPMADGKLNYLIDLNSTTQHHLVLLSELIEMLQNA